MTRTGWFTARVLACLSVAAFAGCSAHPPSQANRTTGTPTTGTPTTSTHTTRPQATGTQATGTQPTGTRTQSPTSVATTDNRTPPSASADPPSASAAAGPRHVREVVELGRSRQGRRLVALHVGDPSAPPVLVVGCIHGSESAGIAVVDELARRGPAGVNLWLIADMNPDGVALGTRDNAAGVDLNRNFAYRWAPSDRRSLHYSGTSALSEPESRAVSALVHRVRPALGIWFHQALSLVDTSQGPRAAEDALAHALHLSERPLADYPGSAVGDEDSISVGTAFVVELGPGPLSEHNVQAAADGVLAAVATLH